MREDNSISPIWLLAAVAHPLAVLAGVLMAGLDVAGSIWFWPLAAMAAVSWYWIAQLKSHIGERCPDLLEKYQVGSLFWNINAWRVLEASRDPEAAAIPEIAMVAQRTRTLRAAMLVGAIGGFTVLVGVGVATAGR